MDLIVLPQDILDTGIKTWLHTPKRIILIINCKVLLVKLMQIVQTLSHTEDTLPDITCYYVIIDHEHTLPNNSKKIMFSTGYLPT